MWWPLKCIVSVCNTFCAATPLLILLPPSLSPSLSLSLPPSPLPLSSLSLSYLATTSPEDVARVEKQTFVCTKRKEDAVPTPAPGVESMLGNWKDPEEMDKEMAEKFQGSMAGKSSLLLPSHCVHLFLELLQSQNGYTCVGPYLEMI